MLVPRQGRPDTGKRRWYPDWDAEIYVVNKAGIRLKNKQ